MRPKTIAVTSSFSRGEAFATLLAEHDASNVHSRGWAGIKNGQERCMDALLVSRDPEVMSGALCFSSTRVPVKNLFDYLEGSSTLEDFLEDFPSISRTTAVSVLEAARERLALDATAA